MDESIRVRRDALADALLDDLERLRSQLFAPAVERRVVTVNDGATLGSHVEIVDIDLAEPTFAAKRLIVASIAQGIDKVLELVGQRAPDEDDWTAPVGTTSIRDTKKRGSRVVRSAGS